MINEHAGLRPLCPPVRLRVGVTGHRGPPKLPVEAMEKVNASVGRTLAVFATAARQHAKALENMCEKCGGLMPVAGDPELAECVIISSLAEGADRIVAAAALATGFGLEAVLPFSEDDYIADFGAPDSRADFEELLDQATSVFVLDGDANERPRAYEAAGFVMLANIDVLVAIWDGDEVNNIGGTAQIVSRAIADGIPIVWIAPANSDELQLSWPRPDEMPLANASGQIKETFRLADCSSIEDAIKEALSPPPEKLEEKRALHNFLSERERQWNFCPWFPLLLAVFAGCSLRWNDFRLPRFLSETRAQWASYFATVPQDKAQRPAIENTLLPAYSLADHLAIYYSLVYRSTYVFNFIFAAVAVGLALTGIWNHDPRIKAYVVLTEFVVIVTILFTWTHGRRQQWHRRWLEYRRLAECLRHMRILAPVGSNGPVDRPGRRLLVDEQDWVNWYAWSLRRLLPLPNCAIDTAYVTAVRNAARSVEIAGQLHYHTDNAQRMAKLDGRMHSLGQLLFVITGGLCFLFVCLYLIGAVPIVSGPHTEEVLGVFTFVTAFLPTLGAALSAVHIQGDFKTVAEQSKRTADRLLEIDEVMAKEAPLFARLCDRVEKASDVMMVDLLEWQTVFRTRPLSLPA
jgi:hypothetical protein